MKIERTGDTQDQTIDVAVSETLTVFEKPDGTELTPVSLDGTANLVYDNTNKYYRLGENGPVVTVQLTKAIDRLRFGSPFIYLELDNPRAAKYVFDVTDTVPNAPGSVMHDYRLFLRGFKDYESKPGTFGDELSIPETLENENCYAKFANADGVYPLTEELKTFLQLFYANNEASIEGHLITAASENCGWMLPLYYYAEAEAAADAIVGEYELVSFTDNGTTYQLGDDYQGVTVENNSVTLSVTNTKFTITNNLSNETISGTWTKNSDTSYTFTVTFFNADDPVTVDTETGEVTVEDMMTYVFKKVTTE